MDEEEFRAAYAAFSQAVLQVANMVFADTEFHMGVVVAVMEADNREKQMIEFSTTMGPEGWQDLLKTILANSHKAETVGPVTLN